MTFKIMILLAIASGISSVEFACSLRQYTCRCTDWVDMGYNVYIECLSTGDQMETLNYNDMNITKVYDKIEIKIQNKNFEKFENFQNNLKVKKLTLRNNKLRSISNKSFSGMKFLVYLSLDSNNIKTIDDNAFIDDEKLSEINLSVNQIETIGLLTFAGLNSLEFLWMAKNKITVVEPNSLNNLRLLKKISLDNNRINCIYVETFKNVFLLEEIYLQENQISFIQENSFQDLKSLKK